MLEESQVAQSGKSVLESLANEGFTFSFEKGPIQVYFKGDETAFYDTRSGTISCRTKTYPINKPIE